MATRIAACLSLIVFALCLLLGVQAGNTFSTTVTRALVALAGTFVVGLALGFVAQKMIDENVKTQEQKEKDSSQTVPEDR